MNIGRKSIKSDTKLIVLKTEQSIDFPALNKN